MPLKHKATLLGCLALIMWGFNASLYTTLAYLPRFEISCIVFFTSFLLAATRITLSQTWHQTLNVPLKVWGIGIMGIYLANCCFMFALQYAPPEKVELISYIWPILAIIVSPLILPTQLRPIQLLGACIAFIGVTILLNDGTPFYFNAQHSLGYLLTIAYVICWSGYVILSRKFPNTPSNLVGLYCGIGALCSLCLHLKFETFIAPSPTDMLKLILMGLTCQGAAYLLWDYSLKKGHYQALCNLSYFTPVISIYLLIKLGLSDNRENLWLSCLLICLGALITCSQIFKLSPKTDRLS